MYDSVPALPISSSIGDYLKAILTIAGDGAASTKEISEQLSVAPASVTNMMGRLQEMGFVRYERYRGASLTGAGRAEALRLIRRHRLIETFLLEHLGYSWQEVHDEAERLEHAVSDEFTERLAEMLGHPDRDPHGDPIPSLEGTLPAEPSRPLASLAVGEEGVIRQVLVQDGNRLRYLAGLGLIPGATVRLVGREPFDGPITVWADDADHVLDPRLAQTIIVEDQE